MGITLIAGLVVVLLALSAGVAVGIRRGLAVGIATGFGVFAIGIVTCVGLLTLALPM